MKRARDRLVWMIVLAVGALAAASRGSVAADMASDAAKGKPLFESHCVVCHKSDGSGGVRLESATSADLRAPVLEHTFHDSDAQLRLAILDGKDEDGEALDQVMPHWRGQLTRREVADIIAFLKTLHP